MKLSPILPFLVACASVAAAPSWAQAQDIDEERPPGLGDDGGGSAYAFGAEAATPDEPLRVLGMLGGGASLRIVNDIDYGQERFGPAYIDGWAGVLLPGSGTLRHALGVQLSLNLTGDGSAPPAFGVDAASQFVVGASYMPYLRFDDLALFPKITVGSAVSAGPSLGVELSVGGAYYLLAGFGVYAEIGASIWWGQENLFHPLVSGELGLLIDYEVLP